MVLTLRVGTPRSITVFSWSVAVGHAWTQAPHDTHSLSKNGTPSLADTFDPKPRPAMVNANVPCTSEQARTHRLHAMHLLSSKEKYGLDSSLGASRWFIPSMP